MQLPVNKTLQGIIEGINTSYPEAGRIVRIEADCAAEAPASWLLRQQQCPRYYWATRDRTFEMAGIGESDVIQPHALESVDAALAVIDAKITAENTSARYYGGYKFYKSPATDGRWRHFKAYRFVLPLLELCRDGDRYFIACNLNGNLSKKEVVDFLHRHMFCESDTTRQLPDFFNRTDLPDFSGWRQLVNKALTAIDNEAFQKVVLARETTVCASARIDPVSLIVKMRVAADNLHLFCFEPVPGRAFLGASPERLYKRTGKQLESEALAGTRPRSHNATEDAQMRQELLTSTKERQEHQIVLKEISSILSAYCTTIDSASEPEILKLMGCQHLRTPLSGILKENISDTMLLKALHPTPAVGGFPKEKALAWLHREEPFERGIYAAPVGWIGVNAAEFCVGIRSGLVSDTLLTLYSGAGIVRESNPDAEWHELNAKLAFFLNIIGRIS